MLGFWKCPQPYLATVLGREIGGRGKCIEGCFCTKDWALFEEISSLGPSDHLNKSSSCLKPPETFHLPLSWDPRWSPQHGLGASLRAA